MHKALKQYNWSTPPRWLRLSYVLSLVAIVWVLTQQRGWVIGAFAAAVYGGIFVASAVLPSGAVHRWSREHPWIDGAFLGPMAFFTVAVFPQPSVMWCLFGGVLGLVAGVGQGGRRRRHAARQAIRVGGGGEGGPRGDDLVSPRDGGLTSPPSAPTGVTRAPRWAITWRR